MKASDIGDRVVFIGGDRLYFGHVIQLRDLSDNVLDDQPFVCRVRKLGIVMDAGRHIGQEFVDDEGVYWIRGWNIREARALRAAKALK